MWIALTVCLAILCLLLLARMLLKARLPEKIMHRMGIRSSASAMNWTAFSWESCLKKLEWKADAVFFGDSLTRGGDFHSAFPDVRIVNLGCSGDTLSGMLRRVDMIAAVQPEKVFVMAGINGLTNRNVELCISEYALLLDKIAQALPEAAIYVHSLLPVARSKEKAFCKNETICLFNQRLQTLAEQKKCVYIDLHPFYEENGAMKPAFTKDGVHLHPEAYSSWMEALRPHLSRAA